MRQCGVWLLLLIAFSNLQSSHQAEVMPADLSGQWLEDLVADAAHTADFVHEFIVKGWWWCTLFNFYDELGKYSPVMQEKFASFGAGKGAANVRPEEFHEVFTNRNLEHFDRLVNFMKFENGILSVTGRDSKSMFHWAREKFATKDEPGAIPVPNNRKFGDLFAVVENIEEDQKGTNALADSPTFVQWIGSLADNYCRLDEASGRYLPPRTACMFPKYMDLIDDDYVPEDEEVRCLPDPVYMDHRLQFVRHMVNWFASIREGHNEYHYHDDLHGMFFSMAVPLFMDSYATKSQRAALKPAHYMAGAMAGLFHDVGYYLIGQLENSHPHGAVMKKAAGYDDAHELMSLMAALWVYDQAPNAECGALCRKIIAHVILATKIIKYVPAKKKAPHPVEHSQIRSFLDASVETRHCEMFDFADANFPVTQEAANGAHLDLESSTARTLLMVKCAQILYHGKAAAMSSEPACAPFVVLLESLNVDVPARHALAPAMGVLVEQSDEDQ